MYVNIYIYIVCFILTLTSEAWLLESIFYIFLTLFLLRSLYFWSALLTTQTPTHYDVQGTDQTYLQKQNDALSFHGHYVKGEDRTKWDKGFGIRHFAGDGRKREKREGGREEGGGVDFSLLFQKERLFILCYLQMMMCV